MYQNVSNSRLYKTRMCRDVTIGKVCPRGAQNCNYAHCVDELRNAKNHCENASASTTTTILQLAPPILSIDTALQAIPNPANNTSTFVNLIQIPDPNLIVQIPVVVPPADLLQQPEINVRLVNLIEMKWCFFR